jgi:hypothetical protein
MLANTLLFLSVTGLPQHPPIIGGGPRFPGCRENPEFVKLATAAKAEAETKAAEARQEATAAAAGGVAAAEAEQKAVFEAYLLSFAKGGQLLGSAENAGLRCAPAFACMGRLTLVGQMARRGQSALVGGT